MQRALSLAVIGCVLVLGAGPALAQGVLSVELVNGYNLVVDSNITSPATYGPKSAYLGARICNTGNASLANVVAYTGDYRGGVGDTPGVFPVRSFGVGSPAWLNNTGSYALTIEADESGTADGTRYIGTLAAGACRMEYWLFSYPQCVNVGGQPDTPPCATSITGEIKPDDDLSLDYDVWATTTTAGVAAASVTRSFTMRNEISASANKIWPNTASKVPDEYLAAIQSVVGWGTLGPDGQPLTPTSAVYPGQRLITTRGIWYDLGNVGAGFDNNGDLVPDQNAWLQPVGDPGSFDADCFRLVNVYGVVIVKLKTGGELLIPFQNRLYFENLPDNTGVVGLVYYQLVATDAGCSASLTPYQEAASGFDNEKFSADYGLGLGISSGSYGAKLALTKDDGFTWVAASAPGNSRTYTLTADNSVSGGTGVNLGVPEFGLPLTFRETIPAGTTYVSGTAAAGLVPPSGSGSFQQKFTNAGGEIDDCTITYSVSSSAYTILYSTDGGSSWAATDPGAGTTDIQWLLFTTLSTSGGHNGMACTSLPGTLETSLPAGTSASVSLRVTVNAAAPFPGPVVCNTVGLGFGGGAPGVTAEDCDIVTGNNTLSGTVFKDDGTGVGGIFGNGIKDGTEPGIGAGVVVELSFDANGDGKHDSGDLPYASTTTAVNGTYSFSSLADGSYIVLVRKYNHPGANNDVDEFVAGWGDTTFDPNLPLTTDQGVLKLDENLNVATLAVNVDYNRDSGAQTVANVNFGFAPPLRLTKAVQANPDANADGRADTPIDEGDRFSYAINLENRLPSAGRQGPTGCEYTAWATTGGTGAAAGNRDFTNAGNVYDATSPNRTLGSAYIQGGGNRWIYGTTFSLPRQRGNVTKVEALYFGYFGIPLTDDYLNVTVGSGTVGVGPSGLTGDIAARSIGTAFIDSYIGEPADLDPNSAIPWDISNLKPNGTGSVADWNWSTTTNYFPSVYLQVNPTKSAASDYKSFYLDAVGLRVTTDRDCEAGASTTLDPVPLRDSYDAGSFAFVSADPPPTSVDTATGVIRWDNVGPLLPGTARTVTVTLRALDVAGTRTGTCGAASPPAVNSACNWAETAWDGKHVYYADGRLANDESGKIAVQIVGKSELRGTVWDDASNLGWPIGAGAGLPGVTVALYACMQGDGTTLETSTQNKTCLNATNGNYWKLQATTLTEANGAYEFIGLDSGYYIVEVGDTNGQPASGTGGNTAPYGKTQTAEPNDNQSVTGGSATAPAGGQTLNNTWGNIDLDLSALNILTATAGTEETINGVDFGFYSATAAIAGNVWHDIDGDAATDAGEGGLAGFTVQLYTDADGDGIIEAGDTVVGTTASDANGNYFFTGLPAADNVIVVTPPTLPGKSWGETVESTGSTASLDNQIPVTIDAGAISGPHTFGYTLADTSDIGDTLYFDFDADGFQDPTDRGIPDVTVRLYSDVDRDGTIDDGVDELVATDASDAAGKYLFEDLPAGSYVVKVDTADPDFPSGVNATGDPDTNAASIGDVVWLDSDGDGSQDAGEQGIPGVAVHLYLEADGAVGKGAGDPLVAATVTDVNGAYLFTGLNIGGYYVDIDETTLPGRALALTTADPVDTLVALAGRTSATVVLTADAGYSLAGTNYAIGNRVWSDANGDGFQDPGEVGVPGVTVTVTNGTGTGCDPACTAVTAADGFWIVTGLTNGTFNVDVVDAGLPRSMTLTAGTDPRTVTVSGADLMSVDFGYRYNTDGDPATEDAGDPTGTISGRIFNDLDGDETYDAGEALSGTIVDLLDETGAIVATAATAADGTYSFTGVLVGSYSVQSVDKLGSRYSTLFLSAGQAVPNLDVVYSNTMETIADSRSAVSVDGVRDDLRQDFGYQRFLGSIGDTVYQDVNENATQDRGEPGIGNVTVELYLCGWTDANANGLFESGEESGCPSALQTTTTASDNPLTSADEGGKFLFSNLDAPAANQFYLVKVNTTTLVPAATTTLIADPDTDGVPCTTLTSGGDPPSTICDGMHLVPAFVDGTNYLGADFGYRITGDGFGTIGDHLWIDSNGNGLVDDGEPGLFSVTVWLDTNNDGILDWTDGNANGTWDAGEGERWVETDSDGYYAFMSLATGSYNVRVLYDADWPAGLPATPTYEAGTGSFDSNVSVTVAAGVTDVPGGSCLPDCSLAVDFGYRYAGAITISGTICTESTLNGSCGTTYSGVEAGESPLAGVLVTFYLWNDGVTAGQAWDSSTGALDAADAFALLGSTSTDASGDYSFSNLPAGGKIVVVTSVSDTQNLDLATTNGNTSVSGATSLQLYEGTSLYQGNAVTVLARQALVLGASATQGVDFAFDPGLGGAIAYDFGDLPASYQNTLLADSGAQHQVTASSMYLGSAPDTETDGQESPTAAGDTDEGVALIPGYWTIDPDCGAGVDVAASAAGWLAGWVDFNQDGDFDDAGERIIDQAVESGLNSIGFGVPATITLGDHLFFARFRIYPERPLLVSSTGLALDAAFQPAGGEVEDYQFNVSVTRAVIASFSAYQDTGAVTVEWETASEVATVGFFLRRRDSGSGDFVQLNDRLLPSLVQVPQGGIYRFADRTAAAGSNYDYELVEVEASGKRNVYGPFTVNTGKPAPEDRPAAAAESVPGYTMVAHQKRLGPSAQAETMSDPRSMDLSMPAATFVPGTRAKVAVRASGIRYLSAQELADSLGVRLAKAKEMLALGGLGNRGLPVPHLAAAGYRGVYFYGEKLDSPYTLDNVYWTGSGFGEKRMRTRRERAARFPRAGQTFARFVHAEEDLIASMGLFTDASRDYWLWDYLSSDEGPKTFPIRSDAVFGGAGATLTVRFKGGSDTEFSPDHHAVVRVNGTPVGEVRWNGLEEAETAFAVPPGVLLDGENLVEIAALGDTGAPYSFIYLDSLDLAYRSRYLARDNRLECTSEKNRAILISGFTNPDILLFDVTNPKRPVFVNARTYEVDPGIFGVVAAPPRSGRIYHATTRDAVLPADAITAAGPPRLADRRNRGEYLVVTTADLREAAARLADHRGPARSLVVDIAQVYDEFNFGIPSPLALKSFLAHARRRWAVPPRTVVLAGNGTYDYRNIEGVGDNLVPTLMVGTPYGIFPSDNRLADIVGDDGVPDIAVGRLPATTAAELNRMIDKIMARDAGAGDDWTRRVLLLADNTDQAGDFTATSDRIADLSTPGYLLSRVSLSSEPVGEARTRVIAGINTGAGILNYVGHGGFDRLADEGLLRSEDLALLLNADAPTFLTAMTCLVGDFANPGFPAIGQAMMQQGGGGAAAVWAPTGMAQDEHSAFLGEAFYRAYFRDAGVATVGDAVLDALRAYQGAGKPSYLLDIFVLLGDPAMQLH